MTFSEAAAGRLARLDRCIGSYVPYYEHCDDDAKWRAGAAIDRELREVVQEIVECGSDAEHDVARTHLYSASDRLVPHEGAEGYGKELLTQLRDNGAIVMAENERRGIQ